MYNSFNALKSHDRTKVDSKLLFPLLRWCSASLKDLSWCNEINKRLFSISPEIAKSLLVYGIKDQNVYIKYPKAIKEKSDKSFELKKFLLKKYYKWSEQEFERNLSIFDKIDWNEIADKLGCDNKERKMLGLSLLSIKKKKPVIKEKKTLFDF